MGKNTQNTQKLSKKKPFLEALRLNLGHITKACESANIHRRTYYSWIDKDEKFKDDCDNVSESLLDLAESKLLENIQNNDNTSIIFFLKTKGRKRGYNESMQIEVSKPISEINFDEV